MRPELTLEPSRFRLRAEQPRNGAAPFRMLDARRASLVCLASSTVRRAGGADRGCACAAVRFRATAAYGGRRWLCRGASPSRRADHACGTDTCTRPEWRSRGSGKAQHVGVLDDSTCPELAGGEALHAVPVIYSWTEPMGPQRRGGVRRDYGGEQAVRVPLPLKTTPHGRIPVREEWLLVRPRASLQVAVPLPWRASRVGRRRRWRGVRR